jgi:F0F1-type ATP synthase epsilon subunit
MSERIHILMVSLITVVLVAFLSLPVLAGQDGTVKRAVLTFVSKVLPQMVHDMDLAVGNDRVMIDEVDMIVISITEITESASKGSFDAVKSGLAMINTNWMGIKSELQVRDEDRSIDQFEEAFESLSESLKTENKSAIIQETQRLSATFDAVVESLGKVDVNVSRLVLSIGSCMLAWVALSLVAAKLVKGGSFKL